MKVCKETKAVINRGSKSDSCVLSFTILVLQFQKFYYLIELSPIHGMGYISLSLSLPPSPFCLTLMFNLHYSIVFYNNNQKQRAVMCISLPHKLLQCTHQFVACSEVSQLSYEKKNTLSKGLSCRTGLYMLLLTTQGNRAVTQILSPLCISACRNYNK